MILKMFAVISLPNLQVFIVLSNLHIHLLKEYSLGGIFSVKNIIRIGVGPAHLATLRRGWPPMLAFVQYVRAMLFLP